MRLSNHRGKEAGKGLGLLLERGVLWNEGSDLLCDSFCDGVFSGGEEMRRVQELLEEFLDFLLPGLLWLFHFTLHSLME